MDILGATALRDLLYAQRVFHLATGCWLWTGPKTEKGYGVIRVVLGGRLQHYLVHRLAFTLWKGPIPSGKGLCHSLGCISPACFNPSHLRPCTRIENEMDKKLMEARRG